MTVLSCGKKYFYVKEYSSFLAIAECTLRLELNETHALVVGTVLKKLLSRVLYGES